jgi:segregation and condensation protein A
MADKSPREGIPHVPASAEAPPVSALPTAGFGYKVRVENYFGPLDLLLHLVREAEVDVTRISLARVAEQYIAYILAMQRLDIELAGEFLVIASQLLLIKSRTLAPPPLEGEEGAEEEDEGDASLELIKKLLDYKRFKDRARALDACHEERQRRAGRPRVKVEGAGPEPEPLRDMELWDLVLLYSRILKGVRLDVAMNILYRDVPLEVFVNHILETLAARRCLSFRELLGEPDRVRTVGTFLALLQLAREQKVRITQEADLGEIRVEACGEGAAEPRVESAGGEGAAEPRVEPDAPPPA